MSGLLFYGEQERWTQNGKLSTKQNKTKSKTLFIYLFIFANHPTKFTNEFKHLVTTCFAHQWPMCARKLGGICVKLAGQSVKLRETRHVTETKNQIERCMINYHRWQRSTLKCQNNQKYIDDLCLSVSPSCSLTRMHARTHILFAFAYTQSQIRRLNCYHMVTIARAANRGKTSQATEK